MDTRLYIRQFLLSLTFMVILHHCEMASASGTWRICPQGQLYHKANMKVGKPYATCCYPTRCGVGEEVKPCTINGTHDTCQTCGTHYNQSQRTSSFTMNKRCVSWPLDENCEDVNGNKNFDDWKTRRCLCDLERGQLFDMPESWKSAPNSAFCQPMKHKCEPGKEPDIKGRCQPCEHGYFKATRGHSFCEPQTECHELGLETLSHGGFTADNNCSEPVIMTTQKPTIVDPGEAVGGGGGGGSSDGGGGQNPPPPSSTVDKTMRSTTTQPIRSGSSRSMKTTDDPEGGSLHWLIILIVVFILVVIIVIGIVLYYRRYKGISLCCCVPFKSTDEEKSPGVTAGHGQYKNGTGNGVLMEPHLTVVTKGGVNNNINGNLPQHQHQQNSTNLRYAQHNGNSVHFSDSSDFDSQLFQNQKNSSSSSSSHQIRMSPAPRHGILRNGGSSSSSSDHHTPYSQYLHSRSQDASIDSIGREKLHVNGFEANQDLGENDPLLVAEGPYPRSVTVSTGGGGHDLLHNSAFAASNSPPINMSPLNPGIYTSASGGVPGHPNNIKNPPMLGNMNPNFNMNNVVTSSSVPTTVPVQTSQQQPIHQVTFAPTADTVTFKRSISVIASPEGEVEEEELEANVPRFSQILPDGSEDPASSVNETPTTTNPILRMLQEKERVDIQQQQQTYPMDSPQRELTHQMRLPSERLQHRPHHQNPNSNTTQQRNPNYSHHRNHQGYPPALFRACSQPTDSNIPDHCIMDLKEQQLANSFHSSLEDGSSAGLRSDSSNTGVLKLEDFTASLDQTNLKMCPGDSANKIGARSNNSSSSNNSNNSKQPEFGMFVIGSGGGSAQNTLERKRSTGNNSLQRRRFLSGSGRQNSVERKRRSSGSESAQNTLEFKRGGDKQRSCLKSFSGSGLEDGETEEKKLRLGRTVSFDAEEEKNIGHDTKPKQVGGNSLTSTSSSSDGSQGPYFDTSVDLRKELQLLPRAAEEGYDGGNESDGGEENTDPKQRQSEDNVDLSSSEDGRTSPTTNTYRRCQSESASSSTEAMQKPPPRSLSEEKPLKNERPIAKVKPMPASDLSVNKLVPDEEDGTSSSTATATTTASSGATGNILDYSSDSSSGEENVSSESPRYEENRQEESDSEEDV